MKLVDVYWSHSSPYCYFALGRVLALRARPDIDVQLRLVLPGILRDPELFAERSEMERRYFDLDCERTAAFLDLPFAYPDPWPVSTEPENLYRAAGRQDRINQLYRLHQVAIEIGEGWTYLDHISRHLWDGSSRNWTDDASFRSALERAGLDHDQLADQASRDATTLDRTFASNRDAMFEAGHWGVPVFVYCDEPFYGQDRFDQLLWRLGQSET